MYVKKKKKCGTWMASFPSRECCHYGKRKKKKEKRKKKMWHLDGLLPLARVLPFGTRVSDAVKDYDGGQCGVLAVQADALQGGRDDIQ